MSRPLVISALAFGLVLVALPTHAQNGPSHDDVADFFGGLRADLFTCGRGWHGSFDVDVAFANDGSVTSVTAESDDAPPDHVRACVVGVIHGGRIRAFTGPSDTIHHSLRL